MPDDDAAGLVGILLAAPQAGVIDISARADARASFDPIGDLPFPDCSARCILLGDAAAALSVRDQIQLLIQCRRVLRPGGQLLCVERDAVQSYESLARWAEFVGMRDPDSPETGHCWQKQPALTTASPLVSILIPSSNPRYFAEALDSALAQTWQNCEIVICDDCETDEIETIAASRAGQMGIRYYKNPERLRARKNFEKCLSLATGEYVKFLNDDDLLEPDCVATMLEAFRQIPDLVLATSHRWRIDANSRVMDDMPATRPAVDRDLLVDGVTLANAVVMYGLNFIGEPSTAMFQRRSFDHRPHIDVAVPFHFNGEEVRGAVDLAMWFRLLVQGNAVFFHKRLSRFRIHAEQAQAKPDVVARSVAGIRGLQKQWIELGLFRRFPPHLLLCRPFPEGVGGGSEWEVAAVHSLPPSPVPANEAIHSWRATARHSFDTA